jgi:microcystin-dependent protein
MANEWISKDYSGSALATTINGAINGSVLSIIVTLATSWPDGSAGPYVATIDRGLPTEEKILVASRSGTTLTLTQRGYDGTAAVAHTTLAPIEHTWDAYSARQANQLASAMSTQGDMATRGAGLSFTRIPLGSTGLPLVAGASVPGYSTLGIVAMAAAVLNRLVPAGSIMMTIGPTADTDYFFVDGSTVVNAQATYPAMWARLPASWKSGTSMIMPDWRGRVPVSDDAGAVYTLGSTAGAMSKTLVSANLPAHSHTIDHGHTASGTASSSSDGGHQHTFSNNPTPGLSQGILLSCSGASTYNLLGGTPAAGQAIALFATATVPPTIIDTAGAHGHTITVTSVTVNALSGGNSGNGPGSSSAVDVTPAVAVVNYQIKAH